MAMHVIYVMGYTSYYLNYIKLIFINELSE